jgi:3'-phosphoadenosine 5'-phosphosulfate sulfotransferase (PAPS reductase)/FAD synthetase
MKTQALRQALDKNEFDVALAGARRDEECSRAKERRVFPSSRFWCGVSLVPNLTKPDIAAAIARRPVSAELT